MHCLMSMVCCLLSTVYCPLSIVHGLLSTVYGLRVRGLLSFVYCLWPTDIVYQVWFMVYWVYGLLIVSQQIITALHTVVYTYAVWKKVSHIIFYRSVSLVQIQPIRRMPFSMYRSCRLYTAHGMYIEIIHTMKNLLHPVYRNRLSV